MNYNWQQKGWPNATVNRAALKDELDAFAAALRQAKKTLRKTQDPEALARALAEEALKVREDWDKPLTETMILRWHEAMLSDRKDEITVGAFRRGEEPMRVVRYTAEGLAEIRYEAPPSSCVPREIRAFLKRWKTPVSKPADVALKAAMMHPHFESIHDFLSAVTFIAMKRAYLRTYEDRFSDRAKKVVRRMFEDGEEGVLSGLSASKWMRMTKVSKATATLDLAELASIGAIVAHGDGPQTRYWLNCPLGKPIDTINDPIKGALEATVLEIVRTFPGIQSERLALKVGRSVATVKRAVSVLVASGKVEHRGSKKTGGYWTTETPGIK